MEITITAERDVLNEILSAAWLYQNEHRFEFQEFDLMEEVYRIEEDIRYQVRTAKMNADAMPKEEGSNMNSKYTIRAAMLVIGKTEVVASSLEEAESEVYSLDLSEFTDTEIVEIDYIARC